MSAEKSRIPNRLSIPKAIIGAFLITWSGRKKFSRSLAVPLFCLVAITVSWYYGERFLSKEIEWALYFLYLVFWSVFAVICHRIVLLDSAPATGWIPRCTWREAKFLGWIVIVWSVYAVAFFTMMALPALVLANISGGIKFDQVEWLSALKIPASILAFYLVARLCLIFPAAALEKKANLQWAWEQSRNNGWRLAVVVGALPFVISRLLDFLYRENATVFECISLTFLGTAIFAVEIAALSISYRELTRDPQEEEIGKN